LYSLSNFVFDQEWSMETKQGVILRLHFEGARLLTFSLEPVMIADYHRPCPADDEERRCRNDLLSGAGAKGARV
jgi:poly-gamma-glutamate synthesis protein (capsule biosynthesis protein)